MHEYHVTKYQVRTMLEISSNTWIQNILSEIYIVIATSHTQQIYASCRHVKYF